MIRTQFSALLFLVAWTFAHTAHADVLEYYDAHEFPQAAAAHASTVDSLIANGSVADAIRISDAFLADNAELLQSDPLLYGRLTANMAVILSHATEYERASEAFDKARAVIEPQVGPFDPRLVSIMTAQGLTLMRLNRLPEAEQELLHAQHILHRNRGVYTLDQLPIVEQLVRIDRRQGNTPRADKHQLFRLRVSEQAWGEDSEELLPILKSLATHFTYQGRIATLAMDGSESTYRTIAFRRALTFYRRAISIVESQYGPNDLRLVEPLRGLSRMRLAQLARHSRAEHALERAVAIIENDPSTDLTDRADALAELGDLYTLTSDDRSANTYLRAWHLLTQSPETANRANELFGTPTRIHPKVPPVIILPRKPDVAQDTNAEPFANAEYTVTASGRVTNVEFVDNNVASSQLRELRTSLNSSRFRPRIVNGELVDTDKLFLHQIYRVAELR